MINVKMGVISVKKRFFVDFTYDKVFKEELKLIPGVRFDPKQKYWHMPMDMQNVREVNELVKKRGSGARLFLMPEIVTWIKDEKSRYANLIKPDDLTSDVSSFLPHLRATRPDIIAAMEKKPWQIPGAAFIAGQRQVILADKPGLGKTLQTVAALLELDIRGPILVIAPRSAVNVTWPDEIQQWVGDNEDITIINSSISAKDRSTAIARILTADPSERHWVFMGPNYLRISADTDDYGNYVRDNKGNKIIRTVREAVPEVFGIKWSAIIVDECHQTLAGSKGDKKKQSAQRQGLGALSLVQDAPMIAISGTPFRGKTENIWGTLNWLFPKKYTSSWNFFKRHYGVTESFSQFGSGIVKGDTVLDERKFYEELRPIMVRRTKEEIQKCLPPDKRMPPKQYGGTRLDHNDPESPVAVWLPMSKEQRKQYDKVVSDAIIYLDDVVEVNVNGALAEMTRFKQLANATLGGWETDDSGLLRPCMPSNKIDWCLDFADDRLSAGTKIIIASQFTQFLELMSGQFKSAKFPHYLFTGKTSDKQRAEIKKGFQGDGDMIILLNTISGGASLNLDMADDVVICDKTWNPDDQEQVEDRAHRPASERLHSVTIWNLNSLDTIDEDIALVNAQREQQAFAVLDGVRGMKYTKELISMTKKRASK